MANDDEQRMKIAGAAWHDLVENKMLKRGEDGAYTFPYSGRTYSLSRPGKYTTSGVPQRWTITLIGPFGEYPFEKGAQHYGKTRKEAVVLMAAEAYGNPCPDGYITGRDSCPGCDAYAEDFDES